MDIIEAVKGVEVANERRRMILDETSESNENKVISMVKDAFSEMKGATMSSKNDKVQCPECGGNLNGAWHDSVHEVWEVSQANRREYEREQRKVALSPRNSKDDRIQYILKLCLEDDNVRHKQWGLWKIAEILDIDISDINADSGMEP